MTDARIVRLATLLGDALALGLFLRLPAMRSPRFLRAPSRALRRAGGARFAILRVVIERREEDYSAGAAGRDG